MSGAGRPVRGPGDDGPGPSTPTGADQGVREARPEDAVAISRLQVRAWRENHAAALGASAALLDEPAFARAWEAAIEQSGALAARAAGRHVLVAVAAGRVVGFAAVSADDPGAASNRGAALLGALEVDPARTGEGHGSRLLASAADTARDDGFTSLRTWVLEDDGARSGFLRGAGLAPDGAARTLDVQGRPVVERSWSARL